MTQKGNRKPGQKQKVMLDGNEAAAHVAYLLNEVIVIYPITPSSPMGEKSDEWSVAGRPNIWGTIPFIQEMQSEGGVAGAVHGALQTGALTTTFTSSQGLLLMLPNMYKIAGELTPTVFHVAARSLATQALSIFGDHSDVMAARATGFAFLASANVQEVMDSALIAHAASLESSIPFVHFFDGFRTSHEVAKIEPLSLEDIQQMINEQYVLEHRRRALSPDHPVVRGTSQNPDVYFQARETVNPYYEACPEAVQEVMDRFARLTGRQYHLFDYYGPPDAQRVIVIIGSGAEACQDTVDKLNERGESVGFIKVRLFRPFSVRHFIQAVPKTVKVMAVLDRTKEPGSSGEPLYLDVVNAVMEAHQDGLITKLPRVVGGRYGLSSKEFTPAMIKGIFDELKKPAPKNHFTIGITDDVSDTSLEYDKNFVIENPEGLRAVFYGLGSDGTVSANKQTIRIIGEHTDYYAQGYFEYDSKKSGSITISHLRFGPKPIHSTYLVTRANFVGCHQFHFLERLEVLAKIEEDGVFLLNSPYPADEVWGHLPRPIQETLISRRIRFYVIDAHRLARELEVGIHINVIMQVCFFAVAGILPLEEAIAAVKESIRKIYRKKGEDSVQTNLKAVDEALKHLAKVNVPKRATSGLELLPAVPDDAPEFVRQVTGRIMAGQGNDIPVSALPVDGTFPVGTSKWEKRIIAEEIPVWGPDLCIQCGKCVMVCPHAAIRTKVYDHAYLNAAPQSFKTQQARDIGFEGMNYTIQVAPEDCTGCGLCVDFCPAVDKTNPSSKALNLQPQRPLREQERINWQFFLSIPDPDRQMVKHTSVRGVQNLAPLFEFSGACAACGETPYIRLITQLFGDRLLVANATGCSSIFGGNLPTTPWTKNAEGRGPAWANSLFEDNAEFGLGFRLAVDQQGTLARQLLKELEPVVGSTLVKELLEARQKDEPGIYQQRERVRALKEKLKGASSPQAVRLLAVADYLVKKSIWIVGGDGWAYDIGFGGLDHVLSTGANVNILVLDTEVYSNTGGQASKSTPLCAVAKFAAGGKTTVKKDLAKMAMTYGHVYVASVAVGAKDEHTLRAFLEAEAYEGPSLIIAYAHCIAHGVEMSEVMQCQKAAVLSGYWPLFRYHPDLARNGKNPFQFDSPDKKISFKEYADQQRRFRILTEQDPEKARRLFEVAQRDIDARWDFFQALAKKPTRPPDTRNDAEKS